MARGEARAAQCGRSADGGRGGLRECVTRHGVRVSGEAEAVCECVRWASVRLAVVSAACLHARTHARACNAPRTTDTDTLGPGRRASQFIAIARTASRAPRRLIPEQLKGRSVRTRQACYSERGGGGSFVAYFCVPYHPRAAVRACVRWVGGVGV